MNEQRTVFACKNIGLSATTPVHMRVNSDGTFTARCGFALFGSTNMNEAEFEACDHNPFHSDFNDNYSEGSGATQDEAIESLKANMSSTAESLWA